MSILLVEDNPGDVRLMQEALVEAGVHHHLSVASTGEEALDFLRRRTADTRESRPDLILLDLNLPGMDGREVLQEIKQDIELRRIPVVVLTTSAADDDILRSYDLRANCYVTKPVDMTGFISVVKSIDGFWSRVVRLPPR